MSCCAARFLTFFRPPPPVFVSSPLPSLPQALPLRDAKQRRSGGPAVHGQPQPAPRAPASRPGRPERWTGALAAYREASWQVVCPFIVHLQHSRTACSEGFFVRLRSFAVQVDEEAKRETTLPNDQPVNLHRIFLGGIPAEVEQTSNRVNVPFQGCIWNLMINTMYVLEISFTSIPEVGMKDPQ